MLRRKSIVSINYSIDEEKTILQKYYSLIDVYTNMKLQ